jgi:hypothetical protein
MLEKYLRAHGVDDLVEEAGAVGLEGLPLQAAPEDDHRRQGPPPVEAHIACSHAPPQIGPAAMIRQDSTDNKDSRGL